MALSPTVRIDVTGARGESLADVARRTGTIAGTPVDEDATDAQVMDALNDGLAGLVAAVPYTVIDPVVVATTANITLSGAQTIDGVAVVATNRVLVKNQSTAANNGIYVAAAGAWTRATDFDQTSEVVTGSYVQVDGGTQAGAWVLTTTGTITVGTTAQTWRPFSYRSASKVPVAAFAGTGSVIRTTQSKLQDIVSVRDFGAVASGSDERAALSAAFTAQQGVTLPAGSYVNNSGALSLPFGKVAKFAPGADIATSGAGATTYSGITIREGYNPSGTTGWTDTAASYSMEGLSVEIGGYGPRQFGTKGTPTALNGSINIPSTATIANHATGVSGYVKSASTTTGGVALYGEANRTAANALVWGINTRTQDGGFGGLNVWGYEMDMNLDNVGTIAIGFDAVGGSSVEPTLSIAYNCQPIGIFASPKKRWLYGFRTTDAAAQVGMELGAQGDVADTASQQFRMNYRNSANVATTAMSIQIASTGDAGIVGGVGSTKLFSLRTPGSTVANIQMLGDGIGFYGASPITKQTVTGSRAGNVALASILTALTSLGIVTNSTTA